MILEQFDSASNYQDIHIYKLDDHPSNITWSENLDDLLQTYENITLFGGRDSFIPYYSGKYPTKEISTAFDVSATQIRKDLKNKIPHDDWELSIFAEGIIHAQENRFPTAYATVDIAVMDHGYVLLGKKAGRNTEEWGFIGGFVDPEDNSLEEAAFRELHEEVGNIVVGNMNYVCSRKIQDWRYRNTSDGIITTLFTCNMLSINNGKLTAQDDIAEINWFSVNSQTLEKVKLAHRGLFNILMKRI